MNDVTKMPAAQKKVVAAPAMDEEMEKALGELICRLNPYSHEMDIFLLPKAPKGDELSQIELEADAEYAANWEFKGQAQRINTAIRIKYRYPVRKKDHDGTVAPDAPILYWLEDYLLIGYEGGAGP
jgi:hypothetical protein